MELNTSCSGQPMRHRERQECAAWRGREAVLLPHAEHARRQRYADNAPSWVVRTLCVPQVVMHVCCGKHLVGDRGAVPHDRPAAKRSTTAALTDAGRLAPPLIGCARRCT